MLIKKNKISELLTIFLFTHLILWTAIPALTNNNLPLDTIEHLAWASNLDWGFNKHPPMVAFFAEIFYQIFGSKDWAYYLLSQIFVIISFFVVFKLAEDFFENKFFCLLAVLLLEGIYFYNFTTPEFNVNICLMPFWALTVFYFWRGYKNNKAADWMLLGLFSGFGILSKYLFIYLGISIDIFLLYLIFKKKINLKCLISFIPFIIVLLPHLIWLAENNYTTITYGFQRAGSVDQNFLNHLTQPLTFLGKQIVILVPFFVMFLFLVKKINTKFNFKDKKLIFLIIINIFPIILILMTSIILGAKIRTMWMTPFYLFFGVLLVYIFRSQVNLNKLKNFAFAFLILFVFSPFAYAYISITQTDKRTDYKGRDIAANIQKIWNEKYKSEIIYVKGDEWYAGNLSYHLKSRPKWLPIDSGKIIKSKDIMLPGEIKMPVSLYGDK
tara:strand:- start:1698 stop:3017 length:1320 start_codon:yes stop_codon:yes gene_type:complete